MVKQLIDLTGVEYSFCIVLKRDLTTPYTEAYWKCKCKCGKIFSASGQKLRKGRASCGCKFTKNRSEGHTTHGLSRSNEYTIWQGMMRRCHDTRMKAYSKYGARGIHVATRWHNFENFYKDMGPRPSKRHSVERKDNSKGYSKDNCKWATYEEQNRNRRGVILATYKGRTKPLAEWFEILGLTSYRSLEYHFEKHGNLAKALKDAY